MKAFEARFHSLGDPDSFRFIPTRVSRRPRSLTYLQCCLCSARLFKFQLSSSVPVAFPSRSLAGACKLPTALRREEVLAVLFSRILALKSSLPWQLSNALERCVALLIVLGGRFALQQGYLPLQEMQTLRNHKTNVPSSAIIFSTSGKN